MEGPSGNRYGRGNAATPANKLQGWDIDFLTAFDCVSCIIFPPPPIIIKKGNRWDSRKLAINEMVLLSLATDCHCMVDKKNKGGVSLVLRCSNTIRRSLTCTFYAKLRRSKRDDLWYVCQGFNRNHTCGGDGSNKMRNLAHMLNLWAADRVRRKDKFKLFNRIAVKYLKDGETALKRLVKDHTEPEHEIWDGSSSSTSQQKNSINGDMGSNPCPHMQLPRLVCVSSDEIYPSQNDDCMKLLDIETNMPSSTNSFVVASRSVRISVCQALRYNICIRLTLLFLAARTPPCS